MCLFWCTCNFINQWLFHIWVIYQSLNWDSFQCNIFKILAGITRLLWNSLSWHVPVWKRHCIFIVCEMSAFKAITFTQTQTFTPLNPPLFLHINFNHLPNNAWQSKIYLLIKICRLGFSKQFILKSRPHNSLDVDSGAAGGDLRPNSQLASTNQQLLQPAEPQQMHFPAVSLSFADVNKCKEMHNIQCSSSHVILLNKMNVHNSREELWKHWDHWLLLNDSLKYTIASTDQGPDSWCRWWGPPWSRPPRLLSDTRGFLYTPEWFYAPGMHRNESTHSCKKKILLLLIKGTFFYFENEMSCVCVCVCACASVCARTVLWCCFILWLR